MKKFVLTFIFSLVLTLPAYAGTIITAPIDGRPISDEYLKNLAEIGDDDYYSVSKENMDFFSSYDPDNHLGKSDKVREELYSLVSAHNNSETTVIINTSSYITNGLVGSRCGSNYTDYEKALEDIDKLVTDFPEPVYYVNITVPRTLPETRFNEIWCSNEEMKGLGYYYLKYNEDAPDRDIISSKYVNVTPTQYIMEFSYVSNKADEIGIKNITPWEKDFLNYFNRNIKVKAPYKQYVDNYKKPYEATAAVAKHIIELQKEGKIDQVVISNDDLQIPDFITYCYNEGYDWVQTKNGSPVKYSYARTYMESGPSSVHRTISDTYSSQELGRANTGSGKFINIIYGTDEVPQLIYARDYARRQNMTAKMNFLYNDTSQSVATFDVKAPGNIARAAYAFVKGSEGRYTKAPATIYIYDYTLGGGKVSSAISSLKDNKKKGNNIGLIELFTTNRDNEVFKKIISGKNGIVLSDICAYSAWNTNGNAIGLGVAQAQVISVARESENDTKKVAQAQIKMLAQHSIEDGLYTKSGKLQLSNKGYRPDVKDRTNAEVLYEVMDIQSVVSALEGSVYTIGEDKYSINAVTIEKLCFPWGRTFDIYAGIGVGVERVRE